MSTKRTYSVKVHAEFLERQAKSSPVQAVAELVWNSLDADATSVDMRVQDEGTGKQTIIVRDNGTGIARDEAEKSFTSLGGSWKKRLQFTKAGGRFLHGSEGRGRFKILSLGRFVRWHVTYATDRGSLSEYEITMERDRMDEVQITDEEASGADRPGVEVTVSDLDADISVLQSAQVMQELAELFGLYLKDYQDVSIRVNQEMIRADAAMRTAKHVSLSLIESDRKGYPVELEIVEWTKKTCNRLYLCTKSGFPLVAVDTTIRHKGFYLSAYLKSRFFDSVRGKGQIALAEMDPPIVTSINEARDALQDFLRDRLAQSARAVVETWKEEKIYPFHGDATTPVEEVERKVFDILAVTASEFMPSFQSAPRKKKAFDLRMFRTAVEKSPEELQVIMNEILDLPRDKREQLAELLQETSLSSIINASSVVADRFKFLGGLEQLLFHKELKEKLKERSQLP